MSRNPKKPNPLLAKFAADLENHYEQRLSEQKLEYYQRLQRSMELDYIIMMLTVNEELHVGPGRAGKFLNAFLAKKMELTEALLTDGVDDPDVVYTKYKLASKLRAILGPENWAKYRELFPFLKEYWED